VEGALNAFELSDTAIALVNRRGEVYRLNRAAETLLSGEVRIAGHRIVSRDPIATTALGRAIHVLMWGGNGAGMAPPVALPRTTGSPVFAYPAKLSAIAANALADCQAIVVFVDPDERRAAPESLLRFGFSLTPAEARLASRLATGASLEDISDEMGISKLTGRTHLKRIFAKLGIGRQSELVALLGAVGRFSPTDH
jgi:DNA-binding CsgD family transcriptional regulator